VAQDLLFGQSGIKLDVQPVVSHCTENRFTIKLWK